MATAKAAAEGKSAPLSLPGFRKGRPKGAILAAQLFTLAILLAVAQVAVDRGIIGDLYLASPTQVVQELIRLFGTGMIWRHLAVTLEEFVLGLVVSVALGIVSGLAIARHPAFERYIKPFMSGLMAIPKVAVIPLLVIWLGIGFANKFVLVLLFSYFPVAYNTIAGVKQARENFLKVARVFEATPSQVVFKVLIPEASPTIFAGVRVAATGGFVGAIFAEMQASQSGLGYLLTNASQLYNTKQVFALVVIATVISILIIHGLDLLEKKVFLRWKFKK
jgi:ABC-type nitrate/sulfonate/bicarbonate transport system permease component